MPKICRDVFSYAVRAMQLVHVIKSSGSMIMAVNCINY